MAYHSLWRSGNHVNGHTVSVNTRLSHRHSRQHTRRGRSSEQGIPRFLLQSNTEIKRKFDGLDRLQYDRINDAADETSPWKIDFSSEALSRNRYSNIQPWEANRVHLKVPTGHCDYINASQIVLRSLKDDSTKRYIATQGPKEDNFHHLWHMIWQETSEVAVIMMLTRTCELGRDKCFPYFPEDIGSEPLTIGGDGEFEDNFEATITLLEKTKDKRSSSIVRKILLKVGDKERIVWHLLFEGWPDHDVPGGEGRNALLEVIKLANEKNSGPQNPLIVHCSAGVGRSGTFVALDHFLREFDAGLIHTDERDDLVCKVVNQLREQRMYMVQTFVQFEFLYQVLKERFQRRSKSASPPSLPLDELAETDSEFENSQGGVLLH